MEYNNDNDTALLAFFCVVFGFLLILGIVFYFVERFKDINYVKMEIRRAYDEEEYYYWRRELHTLYWCLIPGVNPDIVRRFRRFFRRGKHSKPKQSDNIFKLLIPSFLGIAICAVCLMGGTFAWFTASQTTATQTIAAANYSVGVEVFDENNRLVSDNNTIALSKGTYFVKLTATGDATTGYCILNFGDDTEPKYTEQIAKGTSITLNLVVNESVELNITSVWGTYTGERIADRKCTYGTDDSDTNDNTDKKDEQPSAITEQTTENTDADIYTVVSGDTLSGIAGKYKTTVGKLKAYNNLTSDAIQIGQKLNIPPADYEIPKTETTATTAEESEPIPTEPDTTATEQTNNITESDKTVSNTSN